MAYTTNITPNRRKDVGKNEETGYNGISRLTLRGRIKGGQVKAGLKYLPLLLLCLWLGLSGGYAATAHGQNSSSAAGETLLSFAPTSPKPSPTLTRTPTRTPTSAGAPATPPATASIPPSATPRPTITSTLTPTATNTATAAQIERGFQVYKQQFCGLCHQLDAAGTAGRFGPTHNGIGVTAEQRIRSAQYTGTATTAAEYLHESIVNPKAYLVAGYENTPHQMPVYAHLSQGDVEALVQMLLQQR